MTEDLNTTPASTPLDPHLPAGLFVRPTELGTIRLGEMTGSGELRRPVMWDQFRVTELGQTDGSWTDHLVSAGLPRDAETKLRSIPVRVLFDKPELIASNRLEAYDRGARRTVCVGDGCGTARRLTALASGVQAETASTVSCPGPLGCDLAAQEGIACKTIGRLNVQIRGQADHEGTFTFRSAGVNTIRTLSSRLQRYAALFGGLRGLPLRLEVRTKASHASDWENFSFADLVVDAASLEEAATTMAASRRSQDAAGLNFEAYEAAALEGQRNWALDLAWDEGGGVEEFFSRGPAMPPVAAIGDGGAGSGAPPALVTLDIDLPSLGLKK